jgi:large subunit ribosomal protein L3
MMRNIGKLEKTMKALITRKVGMTSIITDDGALTPVTLLSASPNVVTQVKTVENDGYQAIQLGFETAKKLSKSQAGHFAKSKASPKIVKEIRFDEATELELGGQLNADTFVVGDMVHVTGTSKGKGFAGTIKRHNFHRQRKTHGGKGNTRKVGSIGSMYPQKIFKGKKMSGHLGNEQVTVRNLKVALVDTELNIIGIVGAVPGPRKSIVVVKGAK